MSRPLKSRMRTISARTPISPSQIVASSSPAWTVTHSRRAGRPRPLGQEAHATDRVALEVVAEAEVAEHLEERVVPGRVTHVLRVVVLAAGADTQPATGRATVGRGPCRKRP